jgi:uncharacterized RDD family membrane protein YckC
MTQAIEGPERARLLPRLGAALYDSLLLGAIFFAATAAVAPAMPQDHVPAGALWFQAYLIALTFLFYGWFWTHGGQTLGMRAWRLRVTRTDGRSFDWKAAAWRFAWAWLAWLSIIGLLLCLRDGRALHDRLSRTDVVRIPKA